MNSWETYFSSTRKTAIIKVNQSIVWIIRLTKGIMKTPYVFQTEYMIYLCFSFSLVRMTYLFNGLVLSRSLILIPWINIFFYFKIRAHIELFLYLKKSCLVNTCYLYNILWYSLKQKCKFKFNQEGGFCKVFWRGLSKGVLQIELFNPVSSSTSLQDLTLTLIYCTGKFCFL